MWCKHKPEPTPEKHIKENLEFYVNLYHEAEDNDGRLLAMQMYQHMIHVYVYEPSKVIEYLTEFEKRVNEKSK